MDVGLSTILLVLVVSTTEITKGLANALKIVGDSVTLECVSRSNNCDQVEWKKMEGAQSPKTVYRDGVGIFDGFPRQRHSVNITDGCNLTITQLKISDSGRFSCEQVMGDKQVTKGSVLVVISVSERCLSNVTSNALNQYDGYSFWTSINVPDKSVEPSDVILSFLNRADGEAETMDNSQSQTFKTTLTGVARKENTKQLVCWASVSPNRHTQAYFDNSTATLYICSAQQLDVSYPVEKIAVSPPSGPYHKGDRVRCVARAHPFPAFKWTHLKSGNVVDGDTLVINGDDGDQYTCTATNTFKGRVTSLSMTIEVSAPPQPQSDRGSIGIGVGVGVILLILCGILFAVLCIKRMETGSTSDDKRTNGNEEDTERIRINRDDSHTLQYEPLNVLSSQNSNAGPTYEELTIPNEVDITGQSLSNRAAREDKLNENESSLTEYESLQQMERSPSDEYESIKPKKSDKNKKF